MATERAAAPHDATAHAHPGEQTYIKVAIFLAVVTVIEVAIYYIEALDRVLVPALVVLSAVKFVTVVGYFMHLKFDDKKLAGIFGSALLVAMAVFIATWIMQHFHKVEQFVGYLTAG